MSIPDAPRGTLGALANHCPHQGGPLGEGSIENGGLRCDLGTPEDRPYEFEWHHSELSRRYLQDRDREQGPFFDAVREVFGDAGVTLSLR